MDDVVRYAGRHGRFGQGRVRTGGIEGEASDIPSIIFVAAAGAQCSLPLVAGLLVLVGRRAGGRAGGRALRLLDVPPRAFGPRQRTDSGMGRGSALRGVVSLNSERIN